MKCVLSDLVNQMVAFGIDTPLADITSPSIEPCSRWSDQFPIDNYELTQAMMEIIRNGGLGNGGTNFDAKIRRNSTDLEDLFIWKSRSRPLVSRRSTRRSLLCMRNN